MSHLRFGQSLPGRPAGGAAVTPLEIATSGAACLAGLVDGEGRFRYRFDADSGAEATGYNILRHCGTVWAMLDVHRRGGCPGTLPETAGRAMAWLLDNHLRFFRALDNPVLVEENSIKLGANALGVLALVALHRVTGTALALDLARGLAGYMVGEQRNDGDFVHKRFFRSGRASDFRSEYYTGEALLALCELGAATGEARWHESAAAVADRLGPLDYGVEQHSHWMLYALDRLHEASGAERYHRHAERIARHIVAHPDYRAWRRSTPIACRSEGLLAFLRLLERRGAMEDLALRQACLNTVRENLALQAGFRTPAGCFVRGGGDSRGREVRIDYIQHNISAFLHYHLGGY